MNGRTQAGMLVALLVTSFLAMLGGISVAAENGNRDLSIEWAHLATYPEADCTKIHLYVKNTGRFPQSLDGIYLGDRYLSLDLSQEERQQSARRNVNNQSHDPNNNRSPNRSSRSHQWHRALPNPVEPGCISEVTVSLWGTVKEAAIRIPVRGGGELQWAAKEEKRALRLSHIAFDPADPNKIYVYCENRTDEDIAIDHILVDTEKVEITRSIPAGDAIEAGRKTCFIVHPKQKMIWGRYAGVSVVGKGGERVVAVVRVINLFPIGSSDGDTRAEVFFDSVSLYKPMPNLKRGATDSETALPAVNERPYQAYYNGRDPTCDDDGWQVNAVRVITAMHDLWRYDPRTPFYTHVCHPTDKAYAYFGELPDLTLVNPYTILFRPHGPAESGRRIRSARTWIDPRPVVSVSEAFVSGKNKRDLTPDEVSFALWSEIAEGSKGARYYIRKGAGSERGYTQIPGVEAQIARDNLDLQLLKHFLRIGDTVEAASTDHNLIQAKTLLCGDKGIVVFLINHDYSALDGCPCQWNPSERTTCVVEVPDGQEIGRIFEVSNGFLTRLHEDTQNGVIAVGRVEQRRTFLVLFASHTKNLNRGTLPEETRLLARSGETSILAPSVIVRQFEADLQDKMAPLIDPMQTPLSSQAVEIGVFLKNLHLTAIQEVEAFRHQHISNSNDAKADSLFEAMKAYCQLQQFDSARECCLELVGTNCQDDQGVAAVFLGDILLAYGRNHEALEHYEDMLKRFRTKKSRLLLLEKLADVHSERLRHFTRAAEYLKEVLALGTDPGSENKTRFQLAACFFAGQEPREAIAILESMNEDMNNSWPVDYLLGRCYIETHDYTNAVRHLDKASGTHSAEADCALYLLVRTFALMGRHRDAEEAFAKLTKRFPGGKYSVMARRIVKTLEDTARVNEALGNSPGGR